MAQNYNIGSVLTVTPKDFYTRIKIDPAAYILDVRTPEEYADGHLAGAYLLDWLDKDTIREGVAKLNKSKTIHVYCRSDARSAEAASYLASLGYNTVDMDGGVIRWISDGLPVIK